MRKIILMMSVSLDGFFETADRDISWHLVDEELLRHLNGQFRTMGAFGPLGAHGRVRRDLTDFEKTTVYLSADLPSTQGS